MEFASPSSIPPSGAQRASCVVHRRIHGFQVSCPTPGGELALRHQLGVLCPSMNRPKLSSADRVLWAWLSEWFEPICPNSPSAESAQGAVHNVRLTADLILTTVRQFVIYAIS